MGTRYHMNHPLCVCIYNIILLSPLSKLFTNVESKNNIKKKIFKDVHRHLEEYNSVANVYKFVKVRFKKI